MMFNNYKEGCRSPKFILSIQRIFATYVVMQNRTISLQTSFPKRIDIPVYLFTSAVLLGFGLFLPVITLKELVFWTHTFSVTSGILSLFQEKQYLLGVTILFFSIVFPIFKLGVLSIIWFSHLEEKRREFYVHWLGILGKWSMLDVFVIALTIVITKVSGFAEAQAHSGIYFFAGSIMLAMLTTEQIERLIERANPKD